MSTAKSPEAGNLEAVSTTTTNDYNVQVTGLSDKVSSPYFSDGVVYEEDYPDDLAGFPDELEVEPPDAGLDLVGTAEDEIEADLTELYRSEDYLGEVPEAQGGHDQPDARSRTAGLLDTYTVDKGKKTEREVVRKSDANLAIIFANDPDLHGLATNALNGLIEWTRLPAWRVTTDTSRAMVNSDFDFIAERVRDYYGGGIGAVGESAIHSAMRRYAAAPERIYNPWRVHLNGLDPWDGVPRIETAIPGTAHPEWAGRVFLNVYLSLMQRTFEPGCQVDSMLVLVGGQGMRKTSWVLSITEGIRALPRITPLTDVPVGEQAKDLMAQRHDTVITLFDELDQLSGKSDQKALKADLTQRSDKWRAPYGRVNEEHLRRFISIGTTNDEEFLTDETGGRRYWPVTITEPIPSEVMTREHQDLLLAEALARYRRGERYVFDAAFEAVANAIRTPATFNPVAEALDVWFEYPSIPGTDRSADLDRVNVKMLTTYAQLTPGAMGMSLRDLKSKIRHYMDNRSDYRRETAFRVKGFGTGIGWQLIKHTIDTGGDQTGPINDNRVAYE